jgi:hypothetical protein
MEGRHMAGPLGEWSVQALTAKDFAAVSNPGGSFLVEQQA